MKVYVCSTGEYSDWEIAGIFTDKERAERFQWFKDADNTVEEWELDSETLPDWYDAKMPWWIARLTSQPLDIAVTPSSPPYDQEEEGRVIYEPRPRYFHSNQPPYVYLRARDEPHAIKIAAELFARWQAERAGIA